GVGRIEGREGVGYHAVLGWTNWVGRLCGSGVNGRRGRLTRRRCRSRRCFRRSLPGRRRARRDCGQVTPFYEDIEKGSKNHGKSKSHARQDAVATRAVHTAQVSTSSPDRAFPKPAQFAYRMQDCKKNLAILEHGRAF